MEEPPRSCAIKLCICLQSMVQIAQPGHIVQEKEAQHHKHKLASILGEQSIGFSPGRQVNAQGLAKEHGVVWVNHLASDVFGEEAEN